MTQSDQDVTLAQLKNAVEKFCTARDWDRFHSPKEVAIGLVTEASELLEIFRFVPDGDLRALVEKPDVREHIGDELADSLYFILRFAQLYGFDLSESLRKKLIKNESRYPAP